MIIPAGKHAPFRWPEINCKLQVIRYDISFTESCKYNIGSSDQGDVNKLFGIGFYPYHRINSVRFGWNYDKGYTIRIHAYWYIDGIRFMRYMGEVPIGKTYTYIITPTAKSHNLHIMGTGLYTNVPVPCNRFSYLLGPYFGGNQVAPHDMEILMKRI